MKTTNENKVAVAEFNDMDMTPENFKSLGYQVIDMIADYYKSVRDVPVFPDSKSHEVQNAFAQQLPYTGEHPAAILDEWQKKILPNATHLGSPRYFGFVNGSGTMIATLAEALAASVNMNVGAWKPSPAATEIERQTIAWIAELIGYNADCGGQFVSGGTMANITSLLSALRNTASYDSTAEGLQSDKRRGQYTVYMSAHEGHVSIVRAVDVLNLGRCAIRRVPDKADFTMDVSALREMLAEDRRNGMIPFCVIGQAGAINTGAIDPLDEIADVCVENNLWFHVDGACGAVGAMLPEKRPLYKGMERADSITLDPHKWLYIPYECGCVLVKDAEKMRRAFSISAPYLRGTLPTEYSGLDYLEYGPQMSRGFRALKVWMSLKHFGVEGYQRLLRQNVDCAEYLDGLVREAPDFQALHSPTLFIYSFRYIPADISRQYGETSDYPEEIDNYLGILNQQIADDIQKSGDAFIMTSRVREKVVLRMSICSHRTARADITFVFEKLREIGSVRHQLNERKN